MTTDYTNPAELLAVVDSNDIEIGCERRDVIHRDHLLHRAIHLFVFRPDGRLVLQQRSALKDRFPLHWECVGGHLGPRERYADCAIREAQEELGLKITDITEIKKLSASPQTDYEFITVFATVTDEPISPDANEVIATECLTPAQWKHEIATAARLFSPTLLNTLKCCPGILAQT